MLKKICSDVIAPIVPITAVTSKSGLTIRQIDENIAQAIVNASSDWDERDHLDYLCSIRAIGRRPGDRERFYENYFFTDDCRDGDDRSDPNCPMVYQYHAELNTASQTTRTPKQYSLIIRCYRRSPKIRAYIQQVF